MVDEVPVVALVLLGVLVSGVVFTVESGCAVLSVLDALGVVCGV